MKFIYKQHILLVMFIDTVYFLKKNSISHKKGYDKLSVCKSCWIAFFSWMTSLHAFPVNFLEIYQTAVFQDTFTGSKQTELSVISWKYGSRYSRMDQVKFVDDSL